MNFELLPSLTDYANQKKGGMQFKKKSSLKLLSQSQPNFAEMILRWSPFKIVSVSTVLYPRWPPLLKIEICGNKIWGKYKSWTYKCLIASWTY